MTDEMISMKRKMWLAKEEAQKKRNKNGHKWEALVFISVFLIGGGVAFIIATGMFYLAPMFFVAGMAVSDMPQKVKDTWTEGSKGKKAGLITVGLILIPILVILLSYMAVMGLMVAIDLLIIVPIAMVFLYFIFRKHDDWKGKLFGNRVMLVIAILAIVVVLGIFAYNQYYITKDADKEPAELITSLGSGYATEDGYLWVVLPNGDNETVNINEKVIVQIQVVDIFSPHDTQFVESSVFEYDIMAEDDNITYTIKSKDENAKGIPVKNAVVGIMGADKDDVSDTYIKTMETNEDGFCLMEIYCGHYVLSIARGGYASYQTHIIINNQSGRETKQFILTPMWYDISFKYTFNTDFSEFGVFGDGIEDDVADQIELECLNSKRLSDAEMQKAIGINFEKTKIIGSYDLKSNIERQQTMWGFSNVPNAIQNEIIPAQLFMGENKGLQFFAEIGNALSGGYYWVEDKVTRDWQSTHYFDWGDERYVYQAVDYKYDTANLDVMFKYGDIEPKWHFVNHQSPTTKATRMKWTVRVWNDDIKQGGDFQIFYRITINMEYKETYLKISENAYEKTGWQPYHAKFPYYNIVNKDGIEDEYYNGKFVEKENGEFWFMEKMQIANDVGTYYGGSGD